MLYSEDFEDGLAQDWEFPDGWEVTRGADGNTALHGRGHAYAQFPKSSWCDYSLVLRVRIVKGRINLNFRVDGCNRYFIGLEEHVLDLSKTFPCGTHTKLQTLSQKLSRGQWYEVKIAGVGGKVDVYVAGVLKLSYVDPEPLLSGWIGVETLEDSEFYVDDVKVLGHVSEAMSTQAEGQPAWVRLYGPPGGYVESLSLCRSVPSVIYASGSSDGLYKTIDAGRSWTLLPGTEGGRDRVVLVDPAKPNVVYYGVQGLSRSQDGGLTWKPLLGGWRDSMTVQRLACKPEDPSALYVAGPRQDGNGCRVLKSLDSGEHWSDVSPGSTPRGCEVSGLAVQRDGALFLGVNDRQFASWGAGRLLVSRDDGRTWAEVSYGSLEKRFVWSVFADPWKPGEVWLSEGPLYNEAISQPVLFRSQDNGLNWQAVRITAPGWDSTQVRVIGVGADGNVYVAAGSNLLVATQGGRNFTNRTPSRDQMTGVDYVDIEIDPQDPRRLYLPLRATGIAYSENGGTTWTRRDDGIATLSANLIESDPFRPGTVYVSSTGGQGVYRSDDYGETWAVSLAGVGHPWGDEIDPDPHHEGVVWFIADVPFLYRSADFGEHWETLINPLASVGFNFGSFYAFAQAKSTNAIYVVDTGFGIFRGEGGFAAGNWTWQFLRTSEVDYSYALCVEPQNSDVIYSGYSRKPFQDFAMIRASYDGGESWFTSLRIDGAEAVTSIDIDDAAPSRVFAASTGADGGRVWRSEDRGKTWNQPNPLFNFTTIHSYAQSSHDPATVFVGAWGGGTFVTHDGGETWSQLPADEALSAAGIAVDPRDSSTIYIADRTRPVLHRSRDGGRTFATFFDAGAGYSRLMGVTVDPRDPARVYTIAMKAPTAMDQAPGAQGSLFRIDGTSATDVTANLPRLPLSVTVSREDPDTLYAVLHGYGVYKSTDGAASWFDISGPGSGLPESGFFSITAAPDNTHVLYLVGGCDVRFGSFESAGLDPNVVDGVYRSSDGGSTWTCLNGGVLGAGSGAVKSIAFVAERANILVVAAENGLFTSVDGGTSWSRGVALPYSTLGGAAMSGNNVLAFTNGAGVFRGTLSSNGAIGWQPESLLNAHVYFAQVLVDSNRRGTVYASGYPGGVFKSTDGGQTWHEANFGMTSFSVDDPLRQGYYALDLSKSNSDVLYLGLYRKGMYKSIDAGGTWRPMNGDDGVMVGRPITGLTIDPMNERRVFVSTEDGIFRTVDGGQTWKSANDWLPTTDVRSVAFTAGGVLYASTRGYGLFRWTGKWEAQAPVGQWGVIWPIWNDRPRYQYSDILFHPVRDQEMLFGCFPAGIYKSTDAGKTWRESNVGWTLDGVFSLISHPTQPDTVYAGTYNGINRSLDFGGHWESWGAGWPAEQWVFTIAFDPGNPEVMYACSKNGENEGTGREGFHGIVMKSIDGGATWFAITTGLSIDQEFYDLVVDPINPGTLYLAAQRDGMFISTDAGATWHLWNQGLDKRIPATNGNNVARVLAISKDSRYLYFGSDGAGVYRREIHP